MKKTPQFARVPQLQRLFHAYNRRYFWTKLPTYNIVVSTFSVGGKCDARKRQILLHPSIAADKKLAKSTLLHEMAHAATNGFHGTQWRREMFRLAKLGAPIDKIDLRPASEMYSSQDVISEFEGAGFELRNAEWKRVRLDLGYRNGLLNENGMAGDRRCAALLRKCRVAFLKGLRERNAMRTARPSGPPASLRRT